MSLGTPVNWSNPTASPAAQPEAFRYQGESYVRMGNGQVLQKENYLAQQSALNNQAWRAAADNYDPNEPIRQAARAMEAQPYRSPTTNQLVSREQFFAENSSLQRQASNQYDAAMRQRMANVAGAWDTPLPTGVTVDMIPTGDRAFAPAPTAGAMVPARRAAPVGEALRQPINLGIKPRAQPILAKPETIASAGQGLIYGGTAAAIAYAGGAGFFEGAGAGIGGAVGGVAGGAVGGAVGGAAGGTAGTFTVPGVGTVGGAAVGGYVGGGIGIGIGGAVGGAVGQGLGRAIDNVIPDFFEPSNALDPAAMNNGPLVSPGTPPPFTGGQDQTKRYRVTYKYNSISTSGQILEPPSQETVGGSAGYLGPIRGLEVRGSAGFIQLMLLFGNGEEQIRFSSAQQGDFANAGIVSVVRVDGQPDTAGDPAGGIDPVRAPNPARQAAAGVPRTLPTPLSPPSPSDQPWPATPAQETPDTTPLTPPAPVPNFNPTPSTDPNPVPSTSAGSTPTPTDLEAPSKTPPNLADNPLTPPVDDPTTPIGETKKLVWPGLSGLSMGGQSVSPLEVAIPVVLLEGLRQKVNTPSANLTDRTQPNPSVQITKAPPVQAPTAPNPPTCIYERERVRDIQNKATDVQEKASSPVSGFPGLYGIGIESRVKLGQTFDLLGTVNTFMRKAWQSTRLQKVLDVLTFVGVMHNASMLSRNLGQTFLEVIGQGIQAVGIRDEEDQIIDVNEVVSENVEGLLKNVLGVETYNGINKAWNTANRIVSSASAVIMTVRSIADSTSELMEWTAENTGRVGNALKKWRVVGENAYPDMSESAQAHYKGRGRFDKLTGTLTNAEDRLSTYEQATSTVIELEEETSELIQNYGEFRKSVIEGVPDPWADNLPIKEANDAEKAASAAPNIDVSDSQKG